jgi:Arc/MetJ-type ribon-helix-helix transcriptional regulator
MRLITVHLPAAYLNGIDRLVTAEAYPNRSEAIRVAVRDLLKAELGSFIQYEQKKSANLLDLEAE